MAINCLYHAGTHERAVEAKVCASRHHFVPMSRSEQRPAGPETNYQPPRRPTFPELREQIDFPRSGLLHFALPSVKHPDKPFLFVAKRGRVPGMVFVNRITAQGGTKIDVEPRHQLWALAKLVEDQPAAERLYAEVTDHCSRCDRFLSDPVSLARHYGPDCWAKVQKSRNGAA